MVCCMSANAQDDNDHADLPATLSVGSAEIDKIGRAHV